jgi:hypothetical protein
VPKAMAFLGKYPIRMKTVIEENISKHNLVM